MQRRGTTADKLALLPHEPIRAGWTKSTTRNKTRLLIRRQQAGAAQEPDEEDIVHTRVGPLGVWAISRLSALGMNGRRASATRVADALMELGGVVDAGGAFIRSEKVKIQQPHHR